MLAGLALWNKHLPVLLTLALLLAVVAVRRWELLRLRWLAAGGAVAFAIPAPNLVWQTVNGWPQLEMAASLSRRMVARAGPRCCRCSW